MGPKINKRAHANTDAHGGKTGEAHDGETNAAKKTKSGSDKTVQGKK